MIRGFAHSNSFLTLVSPWALQVSGKALVQRFLDALTLRIPITMNLKHIFSAVDTYALGQSLWTEKLLSRLNSRYTLQHLSQLPVLPWGNLTRAGCCCPPACSPRDTSHQNYHLDYHLVYADASPPHLSCLKRSRKPSVSNTARGGTQGDEHQVVSTSTEEATSAAQTSLFPFPEPTHAFLRKRGII